MGEGFTPTRRQLLTAGGLSVGAVIAGQAAATPAQAVTTQLHADTAERTVGYLYSGTPVGMGVSCATASNAYYRGPGKIHAYVGGLYVRSAANNTLRTGPAVVSAPPPYSSPIPGRYPGVGNPGAMRWTSSVSFTPEYRFTGRLQVVGIAARPYAHNGLVFHPVHLSNCDNYYIGFWRRDGEWLTFGREYNDTSTVIGTFPFPHPALNTWHEYRIDVLAGSRVRFYWNGTMIFDMADPRRRFAGGPVGMRLDYFDVILEETRVYRPGA